MASSILIPPFSDPIRKIVDEDRNWAILSSGVSDDGTPDLLRLQIFAQTKGLDFEALKKVFTSKINGEGLGDAAQSEEDFRHSEYRAMLKGKDNADDEFITARTRIGDYAPWIADYFSQIVLVKKLAETRALTGFSRINPPPSRQYESRDQTQLSLEAKPWLPGIRVYGEGLFLEFNKSQIERWLKGIDRKRYESILATHKRIYEKLGRLPREMPARFFLLHTFAHLLIRRLSYECGYGSSALRERIYCWEGERIEMNGVLIYTAAGDSEGTMGGLVELGKAGRFEPLLVAAMEDAIWCSADPLCIESHGQGIDSLNRAACYACALLPETSCEEGNRFLDRVAVTGNQNDRSLGYFSELIQGVLNGNVSADAT